MARTNVARLALSTSTAALVVAALAVTPAVAQPSSAPTAAPPAQTTAGTASPTVSAPPAAVAAHAVAGGRAAQTPADVERHITALHSQFHITQAQQAQWDAFAEAMRSNAAHMQQVFSQQPNTQNVSALDDMRAYATITQAQAQDMQNLLPAFEALYNSMTPAQKQEADAVFHRYARQRTAAERPARRG